METAGKCYVLLSPIFVDGREDGIDDDGGIIDDLLLEFIQRF